MNLILPNMQNAQRLTHGKASRKQLYGVADEETEETPRRSAISGFGTDGNGNFTRYGADAQNAAQYAGYDALVAQDRAAQAARARNGRIARVSMYDQADMNGGTTPESMMASVRHQLGNNTLAGGKILPNGDLATFGVDKNGRPQVTSITPSLDILRDATQTGNWRVADKIGNFLKTRLTPQQIQDATGWSAEVSAAGRGRQVLATEADGRRKTDLEILKFINTLGEKKNRTFDGFLQNVPNSLLEAASTGDIEVDENGNPVYDEDMGAYKRKQVNFTDVVKRLKDIYDASNGNAPDANGNAQDAGGTDVRQQLMDAAKSLLVGQQSQSVDPYLQAMERENNRRAYVTNRPQSLLNIIVNGRRLTTNGYEVDGQYYDVNGDPMKGVQGTFEMSPESDANGSRVYTDTFFPTDADTHAVVGGDANAPTNGRDEASTDANVAKGVSQTSADILARRRVGGAVVSPVYGVTKVADNGTYVEGPNGNAQALQKNAPTGDWISPEERRVAEEQVARDAARDEAYRNAQARADKELSEMEASIGSQYEEAGRRIAARNAANDACAADDARFSANIEEMRRRGGDSRRPVDKGGSDELRAIQSRIDAEEAAKRAEERAKAEEESLLSQRNLEKEIDAVMQRDAARRRDRANGKVGSAELQEAQRRIEDDEAERNKEEARRYLRDLGYEEDEDR